MNAPVVFMKFSVSFIVSHSVIFLNSARRSHFSLGVRVFDSVNTKKTQLASVELDEILGGTHKCDTRVQLMYTF